MEPPFIKGGGVGPSKNWVTLEVRNFLLERRDKPEKGGGGGGVDVQLGGCQIFY